MERFENVRMWEVRFQSISPLATFPMPNEVVLEKQVSLNYRREGRGRPNNMTQLVCTLEGEGAFSYGDRVYPLPPGKGFICRLGDPESVYYYPGHAEGTREGEAIERMLADYDRRKICCSKFRIVNSPSSPFFFLVEKK